MMQHNFSVMFDQKDVVMGVLKNDPRIMSHVWGQELQELQSRNRKDHRAQSRIDQILTDLCSRYRQDPGTICRVLRTMIVGYDVEIDTKIQTFPALHDIISAYLERHHGSIEVYQ